MNVLYLLVSVNPKIKSLRNVINCIVILINSLRLFRFLIIIAMYLEFTVLFLQTRI